MDWTNRAITGSLHFSQDSAHRADINFQKITALKILPCLAHPDKQTD